MGSIRFPNLGFEVYVGRAFSINGFNIYYYGITMALSMICGALIAYHEAKRTGQSVDDYIDYTIFGLVGAVICARIYYVAFSWDYYKNNLVEVFDLRGGGIAIYGGIIGAVLVALIFCKIKKIKFFKFADTAVFGLVLGQILGRWGNFFNREAYGGFTDSLFAMQIPYEDAAVKLTELTTVVNGVTYVQVHPTFLYESVLNLVLLILLIIFRDKRKFYGETFLRYVAGYGVIRFFVEGLRTDQLKWGNFAVSQVLSAALFAVAVVSIVVMRIKLRGLPSLVEPIPEKNADENTAEDIKENIEAETKVEENSEAETKVEESGEAEAKVEESGEAEAKVEESGEAEAKEEESGEAEAKVEESDSLGDVVVEVTEISADDNASKEDEAAENKNTEDETVSETAPEAEKISSETLEENNTENNTEKTE